MIFRRLALSALAAVSAHASADIVALTSNRSIGNQAVTGAIGMDFTVISSIMVTQLGAFDSGQDGFFGPISVGIFNRGTGSLAGTSAVLTGTSQLLTGKSRFFDIQDFQLAPGNYSIVAVGFGPNDLEATILSGGPGPTVSTGGGMLSWGPSSRWATSTSLIFPTNISDGTAVFDAGTFQFTTAVPEMPSSILMLVGITLLAGVLRPKSSR